MKRAFIKTQNVKRFITLMEELKKLPPNIPKLALVYGEHGLGKSKTIQWWADKNDSVYVSATQGMTSRWLLSEIAEELGEEPFWHTQETFGLIENHLRINPKTIQEVIKYINCWLEFHNKKPCPNDRSKSIQEMLDEVQKQHININTLNTLMMKTECRTTPSVFTFKFFY